VLFCSCANILFAAAAPLLVSHFALRKTGIAALSAPYAQIESSLTQTIVMLANRGERVAVVVADNQFDTNAAARGAVVKEHLQVTRAETPRQVRYQVERLLAKRQAYSIVFIIGLLKTFYDEQVEAKLAADLLTDILRELDELAHSVRVLVIITPAPKPTRAYLREQVESALGPLVELPALPAPAKPFQARLF